MKAFMEHRFAPAVHLWSKKERVPREQWNLGPVIYVPCLSVSLGCAIFCSPSAARPSLCQVSALSYDSAAFAHVLQLTLPLYHDVSLIQPPVVLQHTQTRAHTYRAAIPLINKQCVRLQVKSRNLLSMPNHMERTYEKINRLGRICGLEYVYFHWCVFTNEG